ncbi:arabinose ABC transporter permease [Paenibacillus pectinilyticus]|uniref:Arabinose ABC transporter permease n=1 Tax=Paenibacillus pectinilyticus TaxID=512399 RepID=A0A1C1A4F2_9BACL|nr:MFS transporter [Paenibacillus pectinilyticus]OCT15447.1 arabinose ABC transporter permease [Paenibacillus pectinilyticus]
MVKSKAFIIFILAFGIFGIINTEMGVIGILPQIAEHFNISVSTAGLLVSLFALAVAIAGPILPLLFSGMNRKGVMLMVIGLFIIGNIVSIWAPTFGIALAARIIPAFLHPVYFSVAFTAAAASVSQDQIPKAVGRVFMGVTAGMVIGIPITSFIANVTNLEIAMMFFAIVNAITFLAILFFIPSMPVQQKLSYGTQLSVLKKPALWLAIFSSIFILSGMYAVYSFFAEYLESVSGMSGGMISLMLVVFGLTGVIGNLLAGKLLMNHALKTVVIYPVIFGAIYLLVYLMGTFTVPMIILIALWGVLFTFGLNITQYMITSSAPEAPDFSNGLFVAFANLGVTIGTMVGGAFISGWGTHHVMWSGLLFLALGLIFVVMFVPLARKKQAVAY